MDQRRQGEGERMLGMGKWFGGEEARGVELGGVALGAEPWLVLGGGGLRGLAHLGAWEVLAEAGLEPTGVVGTSIGALVGACLSGGRPVSELQTEARALARDDISQMSRRALWVGGVRAPSLYRGDVLRRYLERVVPEGGWEALRIRFQANAVELGTGRTEWFGIGARTDVPLSEALYASSALPVFYPPCPLPGGLYVDGGTCDSLPIRRAAELGATGIVVIDVAAGDESNAAEVVERGMLAIHERVFSIMAGARRRETLAAWEGPPLLYIRPAVGRFQTLDFENLDGFIAAGRRAAERALEGDPAAEASPT